MAVRWAVFGALYALGTEDCGFGDDGLPEDTHTGDRYLDELSGLFSATTGSGDLDDAKAIRWEIMNGCILGDREVVDQLFDRLDAIEPAKRGEHQALRGQIAFSHWYADPQEDARFQPLRWMPALYVPASHFALELARWAVRSKDAPGGEGLGGDEELSSAARWFLASLESNFSLPAPHRAVLARWLLEQGRAREAADHFSAVLQTGFGLDGQNIGHSLTVTASAYVVTADALVAAGEPDKAQALLRRCTEEFPESGVAYKRLAEHYAEQTRYQDAFDCLRQWAEADPKLQSDIWVRTMLAVGAAKPAHRLQLVNEYFDGHPERLQFVENAVRAHWSVLERLQPESRHDWLRGCWMLWWSPPAWQWNELAAVLFARATERELRRRVFEEFVRQGDPRKLNAMAGQQRSEKSREFWKALIGSKGATLGQMLHELMAARVSKDPLSNEFDGWIRRSFPGLALRFSREDADRIKTVRDPSVHASAEKPAADAVEEMCRSCQRLLSLMNASGNVGAA